MSSDISVTYGTMVIEQLTSRSFTAWSLVIAFCCRERLRRPMHRSPLELNWDRYQVMKQLNLQKKKKEAKLPRFCDFIHHEDV